MNSGGVHEFSNGDTALFPSYFTLSPFKALQWVLGERKTRPLWCLSKISWIPRLIYLSFARITDWDLFPCFSCHCVGTLVYGQFKINPFLPPWISHFPLIILRVPFFIPGSTSLDDNSHTMFEMWLEFPKVDTDLLWNRGIRERICKTVGQLKKRGGGVRRFSDLCSNGFALWYSRKAHRRMVRPRNMIPWQSGTEILPRSELH